MRRARLLALAAAATLLLAACQDPTNGPLAKPTPGTWDAALWDSATWE